MIREVTIIPTILVDNKKDFRDQAERINVFTRRVQIDLTDGVFAPTTTLDITNVWWPKNWITDLHMMVSKPSEYMDTIAKLTPSMVIFHAEASENLLPIFEQLKSMDIHCGVALLPSTYPGAVQQYIEAADHCLVFAGQLGVQGSPADLMQMEKIQLIRNIKPEIEIGWDGGANISNIRALAHCDLDVINVGSAISQADNPADMFNQLVAEIDKSGVVL